MNFEKPMKTVKNTKIVKNTEINCEMTAKNPKKNLKINSKLTCFTKFKRSHQILISQWLPTVTKTRNSLKPSHGTDNRRWASTATTTPKPRAKSTPTNTLLSMNEMASTPLTTEEPTTSTATCLSEHSGARKP